MPTKGENRAVERRKIRRSLKDVEKDIGPHVSTNKLAKFRYGAGVAQDCFAKREDDESVT